MIRNAISRILPDGTVKMEMKEYIQEAIEDFSEDVSKSATSPARKNLFDIDK